MITVQCPRCKTRMNLEDHRAGETVACPCGQALKIPATAKRRNRSTWTEILLAAAAIFTVIGGIAELLTSFSHGDSGSATFGLSAILGGLLLAAASHALRYLRRILDAVSVRP